MQNRYIGDIGDYLKIGILRALSAGYRLGIAWWLYPDEHHNTDGRHIGYLSRPVQWRHYDPDLFDALGRIVCAGQRHVGALEAAALLPGAVFHSAMTPTDYPVTKRRQVRQEWFQAVCQTLHEADLEATALPRPARASRWTSYWLCGDLGVVSSCTTITPGVPVATTQRSPIGLDGCGRLASTGWMPFELSRGHHGSSSCWMRRMMSVVGPSRSSGDGVD
jgi:hypothetical protein